MEYGFCFELYETVFTNCFLHSSRYKNGNLKLSLFGTDSKTNGTTHFLDITLDQNNKILRNNQIIVDCKYKPTIIPQLKELGILKEQIGIYIMKDTLYPIYTIDLVKINEKSYKMQELIAT